jgi:predicted Rossmann fold flavoprotein
MSDVIIIGGGASGLMAAIHAARLNHKVLILEHKDKIGKKILATGNGKCNYTNYSQLPECYRSSGNNDFIDRVLQTFDAMTTINFFKQLGIYPKEKKGYVYPNSEQASSVVEVLRMELQRLKVKILCDVHVEHIRKDKNHFLINTNKGNHTAEKIILAAGGCASPNLGSDGSGFQIAKELGHHIIKPVPALVQLQSKEKYFKTIAGVRTDAHIELYVNGSMVAKEKGELLIAAYGVSGIPILQVSRYASRALNDKKNVYLVIDFLPMVSYDDTLTLIYDRIKENPHKNIEENLIGLFHNKLAYVMIKEVGLSPELASNSLTKKQIISLVQQIKSWRVSITDTNPFDQAQVSAGGVDTSEINPDTMESKIVKGLYLTGELIDVDGTCGGYNLQWAWSTGAIAGKSII